MTTLMGGMVMTCSTAMRVMMILPEGTGTIYSTVVTETTLPTYSGEAGLGGVTASLMRHKGTDTFGNTDHFKSIEDITGSQNDDQLVGDNKSIRSMAMMATTTSVACRETTPSTAGMTMTASTVGRGRMHYSGMTAMTL